MFYLVMVEISCYYNHYNRDPLHFIFIKYEKFMKIVFQKRSIIIAIENFKDYQLLFDIYILSLLCTEDTSKIDSTYNEVYGRVVYGVSTEKRWKDIEFYGKFGIIPLDKNYFKNPFLSLEPKRESSIKKQNKLLKMLNGYDNRDYFDSRLTLIKLYQEILIDRTGIQKYIDYENKIIQYEKKIYLLCCVRSFSKDIYMNVMKFM